MYIAFTATAEELSEITHETRQIFVRLFNTVLQSILLNKSKGSGTNRAITKYVSPAE
jgi:hypothetical protein